MGPNRQRKPRETGRGRGRGGRAAPPAAAQTKQAPSVITSSNRELIIDVLQHAATGGDAPVPEKHFDTNAGTRITLHRNAPLSPPEILQRLFESLGFPRDLVTQYLTDLVNDGALPSFGSLEELLRGEDGPLQAFLVSSCFDLFNCMVLFGREADSGETELSPEEGDQILEDEIEAIEAMFSDSFLGRANFSDSDVADRELFFSFSTQDEKQVVVVIRFPDYYPTETPSIFILPSPQPSGGGGGLPKLFISPSSTRELGAVPRRAVMDSGIEAINSFVGAGCLLSLVSAVAGAVASIAPVEEKPAPVTQSREEAHQQQQKLAQQRKAFVGSLTGKATAAPNVDDDGEDRFIQLTLPEKVAMSTVTDETDAGDLIRRDFPVNDPAVSAALKEEWARLEAKGSLSQSRRDLPAYKVREDLRAALKSHNVVVIGGETGSGKTTQIPQYLYEFMCEEGMGSAANIICTQPRRLAATSVALRVAEERDEAVGGTVGYSIRLENCMSKRTRLAYFTTGIVLRRLQTDKFLGKVTHIVVDEIHERGVDTDFLLILLKDLITKRSDLKVILMSATMNSDLFSRYFNDAPVLSIAGRTFPVTVMHLEQIIPATNYYLDDGSPYGKPSTRRDAPRRNTRKAVLNIDEDEMELDKEHEEEQRELAKRVKGSSRTIDIISRMNLDVINYELVESVVEYINSSIGIEGAVLIFMPGMAEIQKCIEQLKSNPALSRACIFYNLHSSLGSSEQQGVFKRAPRGKRKVIVGTNIMETSITIDDAVFVIDTGKAKENRYNARKSLSELVTVNVSKANCRQRQGRAGRVREGYCFRLFTEAQFETFDDHQLCEMHRVPLESLILQIYSLRLGDEVEYLQKALSPPEEKAINSSVKVLTTLGALTREKRLTSLGQHLANLPLDVRIGKMIIHGALLHCVDPVLTIAACLAVRSPFLAAYDFRAEVEGIRRAFAGEYLSDQLANWFAYREWSKAKHFSSAEAARKMCTEYYLSHATLLQIQSTKMQYERYLVEAGFIEDGRLAGSSARKFLFPPSETMEGFVYEAGGKQFNANSSSARCILACLVAGLYPNVAKKKKGTGKGKGRGGGGGGARFISFDGSDCLIHPSSVAGKETEFASPLVAYVDKIKTSATYLREVSMVSPMHVILFGSGSLEYLDKYQELCVDEATAFRCNESDAALLKHIKTQLDSALTTKINNPSQSWESISAVVVRAIVKLLKTETTGGGHFTVIDRREPRAPLTQNLAPAALAEPQPAPAAAPDQPFRTFKSCYVCGETGHVSRYCPHGADKNAGPRLRCFICGQWHLPSECPVPASL